VQAAARTVVRMQKPRQCAAFHRSAVPMIVVDDAGRVLSANRSARLALRRTLADLRRHAIEELAPPDARGDALAAKARRLQTGCIGGVFDVVGPDGSRLRALYCAVTISTCGIHLVAFAPAGWPEEELEPPEHNGADRSVDVVTAREREILQLAADGLSGPTIAERLVLSPGTVKTHFAHIYEKLGVHDRIEAVARAFRLGLID
jgi:DNA-binding CsgD family transcriptional regulator